MSSALQKLDETKFSFFYFKIIVISGMGFLTDAYDLFVIGLVTALIGRLYYTDNPFHLQENEPLYFSKNNPVLAGPGKLPLSINAAISATALVGTLVGQIFFGFIGDKFGRKSAYGITLAIMIFAAIAQSMSFGTSPNAIVGTLCLWRFLLGFGVGGDYPICATIMSEFSNRKNRGAYIGSVFAMQGMGFLLAAAITAITAACLDAAYPSTRWPIVVSTKEFNNMNNLGVLSNGVYTPSTNGASYKASDVVYHSTGQYPNDCAVGEVYLGAARTGNGIFCYPRTSTIGANCVTFACLTSVNSTNAPVGAVTGSYNYQYCPPCPTIAQQAYYSQIHKSCPPEADFVWRIVLAFGAFPGLVTIYSRTKISESPRYTAQVEKAADRADADIEAMMQGRAIVDAHAGLKIKAAEPEISMCQFFWKYRWQLLGTTMCWFLLDVAFYSQGLFQSQVFLQVGFVAPAKESYALEETAANAKAQAIIALGSTIPGYWATVLTVDIIGRKTIQLMGFIVTTALMAALALSFNQQLNPNNANETGLSKNQPTARNGWIAMYAICFFFMNFGPNSTTFIYPAELFPTVWKSTGHGLSAAAGKAGAIIGAFGFLFASQSKNGELTWSFPCKQAVYENGYYIRKSDLTSTGACNKKPACPTGRIDFQQPIGTTPDVNTHKFAATNHCDFCLPGALSGCYPFGIGIVGALGILAATNFVGMLFTFLLPETNQKSLEELNGSEEPIVKDEKELLQSNKENPIGVYAS